MINTKRVSVHMATKAKKLTPLGMALEIETIVSDNDMSYMDAIIYYSELNNIDPEDLATSLHVSIVEKLKLESISLNLIEGEIPPTLPFLDD